MNERDYLVGYKEALESISEQITQASKRYPNNPLAVLNDVIVKVQHELAEKRIALRDIDEFEELDINEEEIEEIAKAVDGFIRIITQPNLFTVEKVKKGGQLI